MKIALVGNQNSGKTTIFNILTKANQKIGNWPGVTIEKKEGEIEDAKSKLTDLPGIYSLSPYTIEEEISRKYILEEKPDLILNIVDVTSLERSIYLTLQLLELNIKVIVALNMIDRLEEKGIYINKDILSKELGVDVVEISALKNIGISRLKDLIKNNNKKNNNIKNDNIKKKASNTIFKADIENEILKIQNMFNINRFEAIKILENDKMYNRYQTLQVESIRNKLKKSYNMDIDETIANQRYNYIDEIRKRVLTVNKIKKSNTDKLDSIFLNKYLSIPLFLVIMGTIYYLSVGVGTKLTEELLDNMINNFGENIRIILENLRASNWSQSLVIDGIVSGVGAVIRFIPQLIILFFCISILETTGYMARITFLLDKIFRKIGLSGNALVPFILGLRM